MPPSASASPSAWAWGNCRRWPGPCRRTGAPAASRRTDPAFAARGMAIALPASSAQRRMTTMTDDRSQVGHYGPGYGESQGRQDHDHAHYQRFRDEHARQLDEEY